MVSFFYIRLLTITSLLFLCICCGIEIKADKKEIAIPNYGIKKDSILSDTILKEVVDTIAPKAINLKTAKSIEILSITKEMLNGDSTVEDYQKCKPWALTVDQLKKVIREFEPMSSELQYLTFLYMPCRMKGEIEIDNIRFKYWINAGSTLTLKNERTELYFGCTGKACLKFFLSGQDDGKEDN